MSDTPSDTQRLSKRLIALTGCSRREAELYIEGGMVTVDGAVVDEPQRPVTAAQVIELATGAQPSELPPATLLLHKPAGLDADATRALITPDTREIEQLDRHLPTLLAMFRRLTPCLPLPTQASGLQVYTQDWQTVRYFNQPNLLPEQEYLVDVEGQIADDGLARLNSSHTKASWQSETRLRFASKTLDPAYIGSRCAEVGLQATGIKRLRVGRIALSKLPVGRWRLMPPLQRF